MNTDDTDQRRELMMDSMQYGNSALRRGKHDDITERVIGVFYEVYNELGFGFLEAVYKEAMRLALTQAGLQVQTEVPVPVSFRGVVVGIFRADLIVNGCVLVELKAAEQLVRQHASQTMHYLRATTIEVTLLMNFGVLPRFQRIVLDNSKRSRGSNRWNR